MNVILDHQTIVVNQKSVDSLLLNTGLEYQFVVFLIDANTKRVECGPRRLLRVRSHLSRDNLPRTHQGRQIHVTNFAHHDKET